MMPQAWFGLRKRKRGLILHGVLSEVVGMLGRLFLLFACSWIFTRGALEAEQAPAAFLPAGQEAIQKELAKAVQDHVAPGAVFWEEHAGAVWHTVLGNRALQPEKEPLTEDTIFDLASLTKVIATAPCIMHLLEEGKLTLEGPAHTWLTEFTGEGREKITLRHLLTHTSGLRPSLPLKPDWTGYTEGINRALHAAPTTTPGTAFRYSDVNFILLGEIVRRVSGERLDAYAERVIYRPLGMTATLFCPPVLMRSRIAPTERDEHGAMLRGVVHDPTARRMGGVAGHAGLFICASDLARYARMLLQEGTLDGVRIFQPETVRLMTRVQTGPRVYERRGLGWDLDSPYSKPRGDLFPLGSYGHTGFTGTALWIDPASHSFYVLLTSRLYPDGKGDTRKLYRACGMLAARSLSGVDFTKMSGAFSPRLTENETPTVLNGIDVLVRRGFTALAGLRVGLITNPTGIDQARHPTVDLLAHASGVKLVVLFSPEHGIRGTLDQEKIADGKDEPTGLPVYSLYGERRAPTDAQLAGLDALVFDVQDVGCRFYTYISTLKLCLEAAAKAGKKFVVLDRVNPVGGTIVEGPATVEKQSFTACHPIPLRHGLTVGELAKLLNAELNLHADLTVIPIEGWMRGMRFEDTGLPWLNPSPNMRGTAAALLYPGVGLFETALSVGRGTDTPFEIVGAPFIDDVRLADELSKAGLEGVSFTPLRFTPTASVFKGKLCGGVRLVITDAAKLRAVDLGMALAVILERLYPKDFKLDELKTLLQHQATLTDLKAGKSWQELVAGWREEVTQFENRRAAFLLYE